MISCECISIRGVECSAVRANLFVHCISYCFSLCVYSETDVLVWQVTVGRSNAFSPVFSQSVFDADLMELQPAGVTVTTVSATDRDDSGVYGDVTYSIVGEDDDEVFAIDSQSGSISA